MTATATLPAVPSLPAFAPAAADLWALGGWAIVVAAAIATVALRPPTGAWPGAPRGRRAAMGAVAVLLLLSAVLPVAARFGDGLTWAAVLRGHAADPGAVLVVVALWRLAGRLGTSAGASPAAARRADTDRTWMLGLAALAGWTLILTQLTTDRIDVYRLGYHGGAVAVAAAAVALAAAWAGLARTATAIAAALAAWGLGLPESPNLWDALADPCLTVAATAWCMGAAWRRLRGRAAPHV